MGDLGWSERTNESPSLVKKEVIQRIENASSPLPSSHVDLHDVLLHPDLESYRPSVSKNTGEWFVSEIDLAFIAEGLAVLGTGGGGSVHTAYLNSVDMLRSAGKGRMRIVDPGALVSDSKVALVAYAGSPSVSNERLAADELHSATLALSTYLNIPKLDAVMAGEIGGSNGMRAFSVGSSLDIPVIDGDTMGRAFPKLDLVLPYVYGKADPSPAVLSDARGNIQVIAAVESSHRFETMTRVVCQELGLFTGMSLNPLSGRVVQDYCCHRGLSSGWFIGREIYLARLKKTDIAAAVVSPFI